ncbi:Ig-like domain-containing protein [Maricaulis sp.]|uniref:Ig-like domain-containing protein n=1 Tax=Maricaulis sp. TaxID=1486257 RepID=UPI001B21BA3E|nr:Ig-like domain-containing protein [Maricaulis sp.]MBO6797778.1 choice-of-anchor D domain-containing protein [Maricaulis sp.]
MLSLDRFSAVVGYADKALKSFALAGVGAVWAVGAAQAQPAVSGSAAEQVFSPPPGHVSRIEPGDTVSLSYTIFESPTTHFEDGEMTVYLGAGIPLAVAATASTGFGCDLNGAPVITGVNTGTISISNLAMNAAFSFCSVSITFVVPEGTAAGNYTISATDLTGNDDGVTPFAAAIGDVVVTVEADDDAPNVEVSGPAGPVSGVFNASVSFTDSASLFPEQVEDFDVADLLVSNATVSLINQGGDAGGAIFSANLEVTPTGGTPIEISLPAASVTDIAGNANNVSNTYSVAYDAAPPVDPASLVNFTNEFLNGPFAAGGTPTHRFTIENTSSEDMTITFFTENIQAGLTGLAATGGPTVDTCGGTLSGTTFLIYTGGSLTAGNSCTIEVPVLIPAGAAPGSYGVQTSLLSASLATTGAIIVDPAQTQLEIAGFEGTGVIDFSKEFTNDPVGPGEQVTLEFTISAAGSFTTSDLSFTDDLDAALSGMVATGLPATDVCGSGSTLSGTDTITLTNGSLAQDASCTFSVTVDVPAGATHGEYTNTTSLLSATRSDVGAVSIERASDTLNVEVIAPTVRVEGPAGPVSVAENFTVDVTFSEDVTGVEIADLSLVGATAAGLTGSGTDYQFELTPTGVGTATAQFNADGAVNGGAVGNLISNLFEVDVAAAAPEAQVEGLGAEIVNGDATPSGGDATLFAPIDVAGGSANAVFTIRNVGTTDLTVGTVSLVTGTDFSIASQPTSPIAAGASTTFTVTFDPTALGERSDTLSFVTNDADENPYTFGIAGNGITAPEINVADAAAANDIADGDVTPSAVDGTDFGNLNVVGGTLTTTFTIENVGGSALTLGSDAVSISGSADFTVASQPATSVGVGSSETFTVTFDPSSSGSKTATISITNNDADESPYTFAVQGFGVDNEAPSGYSVAFDASIYGPAANTTASFTIDDPEIGATFDYSISSSGGGAPVTGSGTIPVPAPGSPSEYQVSGIDVSGLADGTLTVSVSLTDTDSNVGGLVTDTATHDTTAPTPVLSTVASDPVSGAFTLTLDFGETVTGFTVGEISVGNGAASGFSDDGGGAFSVTITPASDGTVAVDVAAAVAQDAAGNDNNAATQFSIENDETAPTMTISSGAADPVSGVFSVTVTFSESVTGFAVGDISVGNGAASNLATSDNTTFTADITPAADGSVTVDVAGAVAQDAAGNDNTAATQFSITNDETPPTVSSVDLFAGVVSPTDADIVSWQVDFSEDLDISTLSGADFVATGTTATPTVSSLSNSSFEVSLAGGDMDDLNATVTLALAASPTISDLAGNALVSTAVTGTNNNSIDVINDTVPPTLTITTVASDPVSGVFSVSFNFDENVTGFTLSDITVGNGAASNFAGFDDSYTADITPTADGPVTVDVAAAVAQDLAGNDNVAATQFSIENDETPPTVTLTSTSSDPVSGAFPLTVTFSEAVSGFALGDIAVGNGTASNLVTSDNTIFTADITPTGDGTVTVDVAAAVAQDAAGNDNTVATQFTIENDETGPTVRLRSAASDPVSGVFSLEVLFDEAVTGFAAADLVVGNGSASNLATADNTTFSVDITPAADGSVTVDVPAAVAQDAAGNDNDASSQFTIENDETGPSVTITTASSDPVSGSFSITISFSEVVSGFAIGDLVVGNGSAGSLATADNMTFTANVRPTSGGTVTVDVAAGVAQDAAGNDNTAAAQFSIENDETPPGVVITSAASDPVSGVFSVSITFDETVTGLAVGDITVGNGAASNLAGSGTSYTADITPASDGTVTVDIAAGVAQDAAGNTNTAAAQFTIENDETAPGLAITTTSSDPVAGLFSVTFTFDESVTGFVLGDIAVGNGAASNFAGSGTTYTADITPAADGAVTVDVAADVAQDAAGNGNTAAAQFSIDNDETGPTVDNLAVSDTDLRNDDVGDAFTVAVDFSEQVDTASNPTLSFAPDVSAALSFQSGAFSNGDTTYTATYTVLDSQSSLADIDVTVSGVSDLLGNALVDDTTADVFSVEQRRGSISIVAEIDGLVDGEFDFTSDLGSFAISTTAQTGTENFTDLSEGAYGFAFTEEDGFSLSGISCVGGTSATDAAAGTLDVTLAPTDAVTCTFALTADPEVDETEIPQVEITLASASDDPTSTTTTFDLTNTGGSAFFFEASTDAAWLTVDPTSGSIPASGSLTFTVSFTAAVLDLDPGTYNATITITETAAAGQKDGLARANTLNTINIPVTITLEPREGTLTLVSTTLPDIAGQGSFSYTSDLAEFDGVTLTTVNGSASTMAETVLRGQYDITQAAAEGWRLSSIICTGDDDNGSSFDLSAGTATIDLDPEEVMTCTFANVRDEDYIREITTSAIRSFMAARADQILTNAPDLSRRMRTADGVATQNHFSANLTERGMQANFSTSLNAIRMSARDDRVPSDRDEALGVHRSTGMSSVDVWFEASYASVTDDRAGLDAESDFGMYSLGVDFLHSEDLLLGAMLQFDSAETVTGEWRSRVEGDGWMAGPYMVARLSENLYFDARGAWGRSENEINPIGTYWDEFDTERMLFETNLTGDYRTGGWRITPELGVAYFSEEQAAYTDSLGIFIPSQEITIGRASFGPEFAYRIERGEGGYLEPYVRLNAIWDYESAEVINTSGVLQGVGDFRADARLGVNAEFANGGVLSAEVGLQGVGQSDFEANNAMIRIRLPLSMD